MGGGSYSFTQITQMVKAGKLDIKVVDQAAARVLKAKFTLGLFEKPYLGVAAAETPKYIHTDEHVALARQIDTESIVLLENHNNILPLANTANVAVIGPMGHGYMNVSLSLNLQHLNALLITGSTVTMLLTEATSMESPPTTASRPPALDVKFLPPTPKATQLTHPSHHFHPRLRALVQRPIRIL